MLKTLGSVMNTSPGPASTLTSSTLNTAGKMMKPLRMATTVSMMLTPAAVLGRFVSPRK